MFTERTQAHIIRLSEELADKDEQLAALREAAQEVWEADQEGRMIPYSKRLSDAIDDLGPLLQESRND